MRVTIDKMMACKPCQDDYPRARVEALWSGRTWVHHRTIARFAIPVKDRMWALSNLMGSEANRILSRRIALDVVHLWDAPEVVIQYLKTGDPALRVATWDAASAVMWDAALDAALDATARKAASAAAMAAARKAASAAAMAAAMAAASATAMAAAMAAAMEAVKAASADARVAAWEKYLQWAVAAVSEEGREKK